MSRRFLVLLGCVLVFLTTVGVLHFFRQRHVSRNHERPVPARVDRRMERLQDAPDAVSEVPVQIRNRRLSAVEKRRIVRRVRRFAEGYAQLLSGKRRVVFHHVTNRFQQQLARYIPRISPAKRTAHVAAVRIQYVAGTTAVVTVIMRWSDRIVTATPVGVTRNDGRWFVYQIGKKDG